MVLSLKCKMASGLGKSQIGIHLSTWELIARKEHKFASTVMVIVV